MSTTPADTWPKTAYPLRRDAVRDPLTGLYNRGFFEEALIAEFKRCRRRCAVLGLLFLDLDGFKLVNDRMGHATGDQLLQQVAATLQGNVRAADIVARYGGDQFCIIVGDASASGVQALADRLLQALQELRVVRGDLAATLDVSIGAVVCFPRRGTYSCGQVLNAADKAMDSSKTSGRNRVTMVSLMTVEDAGFLREVQACRFSQFLIHRGRAGENQILKAPLPTSPVSSIGRLARQLGWIDREQLQQVLLHQRRTKQLFGEIAVARGLLSQEQVYGLLALQHEPPEDLMEALVGQGLLSVEQAQEELVAYCREVLGVTCLV